MDLYEWKTKNANARKYAHFDEKVSLDKVWDYISDPTNIVKHGFYPFIHYEKKFNKFTRKDGIKEKSSTPSGQQQEFTLMENFAILH